MRSANDSCVMTGELERCEGSRSGRERSEKKSSFHNYQRIMFSKSNGSRWTAGSMLLVAVQLTLLLHSVGKVRSFTPHSKQYVLPKYSHIEVTDNSNNGGDAVNGDAVVNGIDETNGRNNTIAPVVESTRPPSLPTNTVKPSMTTPVASLKKEIPIKTKNGGKASSADRENNRKMDLMWCQSDRCQDVVRERVVGNHNTIVFNGPATGQVAYRWNEKAYPITKPEPEAESSSSSPPTKDNKSAIQKVSPSTTDSSTKIASVLLLVKRGDEALLQIAAKKVPELTEVGIDVLMSPELAAKLKHYFGVDDERISLFEQPKDPNKVDWRIRHVDDEEEEWVHDMNYVEPFPDLVVTLGGDGLLMYASSVFQGPIPPLLAISGGSLGFLTAFSEYEMTDAIKVALGMATPIIEATNGDGGDDDEYTQDAEEEEQDALQVFPPNMPSYPYEPLVSDTTPRFTFGMEDHICMTIRMRLDCRVVNRDGVVRARYNVLNEVVIDRGSSPYLAALECFCDDVHLTTVQADGVIFAT
mmetsp:Transcript_22550/g.50017  ORF Transcript_22550/g.50017 Transcript_22550/m.50017 type:complete len:527 (+) Transcript_22550:246-1826(+)